MLFTYLLRWALLRCPCLAKVDVDDKCSTWCFRVVAVGSTPATYSDHASMVHSWDVSRAVDFVISVMLQLHRVLQVQEAP
eukprot:m.398754 g.398754  ORF g.398754 m.398754 type:complete len:80 (+) comp21141_c0_seq5:199-438(+)